MHSCEACRSLAGIQGRYPLLFKFCAPSRHSLDNVKNSVLFCRHYAQFNDPFEFKATIHEGPPLPDSDPLKYAAAATAWGFPDGVPDELKDDASEYFDSLKDGEPAFEKMFDRMRITCFGTSQDNLLMWSHYADGLRGFCIAFDDEEIVSGADEERYLTPVEYLDVPPTVYSFVYSVAADQYDFHLMAIDEGDSLFKATGKADAWRQDYEVAADEALDTMKRTWRLVFAAKPREWQYEQETRLLVISEGETQESLRLAYPPSAVKGIIIGERMDAKYREELINTLSGQYDDVPISMAVRADGSYQLEVVPFECQ